MLTPASLTRRPIAERSIRVLVTPTPITFAERRSVLQVLEQYGPIEAFKMTPNYHSNFVSIAKEATTATKLVACSPLLFRMAPPKKTTNVHIADLVEGDGSNVLNSDSTRPSIVNPRDEAGTDHDAAAATGNQDKASEPAEFKLEIFPAPDYHHHFDMTRSPLYRSWPTAYADDKSYVASTLKQSLPQTMASKGLAHWLLGFRRHPHQTDGKFERMQLKSWLPSKMAKAKTNSHVD